MSPSTDLVDDEMVTITARLGHPVDADHHLSYCLCPSSSTVEVNCARLTESGLGQVSVAVRIPALLRVNGPDVDCRSTSCSVVAVEKSSTADTVAYQLDPIAVTAVGFDPSASLRTPPTLRVTPATGLVDGQSVSVSVQPGDRSHEPIGFETVVPICPGPVATSADLMALSPRCGGVEAMRPSTGGALSGTLSVNAFFETSSGPLDCRASAAGCSVVAVDPVGQLDSVTLDFVPDSPAQPTMWIRPPGGIAPPVPVTFDLVGFTPGDPFAVKWCNTDGQCRPETIGSGTADPARLSSLDGGGVISCVIEVVSFADFNENVGAPIAFKGATFKDMPWSRAQVATPVVAEPTFTG